MPPRRKKFQVPRKTSSTSSAAPPRVVTPPPPKPAPTEDRAASRPLTAEQRAAVDAPLNEPLAIVAGAGSGKTETLTRRVARAVKEGAPPASVLVLTFSNKAAKELLERLRGLGCDGVEVRTFHGFSLRLLRRFGDEANLGRDFVILGDAEQKSVVKKCCEETMRGDDDDNKAFRQAWGLIKRARSRGVSERDLDGNVGNVFRLYRQRLRRMRAVDFDDVIDAAAFACNREASRCGSFVRSRYKQGFVDEWQDTSHNQLALLASIFGFERAPLTVVGDDDQAVYGWRDALPAAFEAFSRVFAGATILPLTQNYRSGGHVVMAARAVVKQVAGRVDKDLWTARSAGEPVAILRVEGGPHAEARVVALRIQRLLSASRPRDIAVLCRSASPALRLVEKRLTELHIKCRVVGGQRFFERPVVRAALSYLRLARNELDDAAAETVLLKCPGVGPKTLEKLRSDLPLLGACRAAVEGTSLNEKTRGAMADVLAALDRIHTTLHAAPRPLRAALKLLDPLVLPPSQEAGDEGIDAEKAKKRRVERATALDLLEQLRKLASQKEDESTEEGPALLREFLDTCALDAGGDADDLDEVTLSTIHKAKGLEWPHVFLVRANDGVLPASGRASDCADGCDAKAALVLAPRDDAKRLEEERRLFHVAITRARESFTSTYATRELGDGDGGGDAARPSPFLKDLPTACVRRETVAGDASSPPPPPRRAMDGSPPRGPPVPAFQTAAASIKTATPPPAAPPPPPSEPKPPPPQIRCRAHRVACAQRADDGSYVCALPADCACGFVLGADQAPAPVRGLITTFFAPRAPPATPVAPPPRALAPPVSATPVATPAARTSLLSPATRSSRGSASSFLPPVLSPAAAFALPAPPEPAAELPSTQDFCDCLDDFEAQQAAPAPSTQEAPAPSTQDFVDCLDAFEGRQADNASDDGELTQPYVPPELRGEAPLRAAPAGHLCPHGNPPGCAQCAARQRNDPVAAAPPSPAAPRLSSACRDVNLRDVNAAPAAAKALPAPVKPTVPTEPTAPAAPPAPAAPSRPVEPPAPAEPSARAASPLPAAPSLPVKPPAPAEPAPAAPPVLTAPPADEPSPPLPSPPPECAICLGEIDDGAQILQCGHAFHVTCIGELVDHAPRAAPTRRSLQVSCPLCRNVCREPAPAPTPAPAPAPAADDEADLVCRPKKVPKKRRRAPRPPPEPPGSKKKRAHEFIAPYRDVFWEHLNAAVEKQNAPRKKRKRKLVKGQTKLTFAPRPPPPPGPPPEDSAPPPPPEAYDADLTQD